MSIDTIGDFLTIIRNGLLISKKSVSAPYSKMKESISDILKEEGFIKDFTIGTDDRGHKNITIMLKYVGGESVIHELQRISTPGRRAYEGVGSVKPVIGGIGISILTTNKGVMTDKKAKQLAVGGEIICTVW